MNDRVKVCRRIFFVWQEEKEEKWLRSMSLKGWHLMDTGICTYYFEKGEPLDMIYKLDFKATGDEDMSDYKELFENTGWKYVSRMNGWHYFRTQSGTNTDCEIYTNNESKLMKYSSLLKYLLMAGASTFSGVFLLSVLLLVEPEVIGRLKVLYFIVIAVGIILGYSIIRIWLMIKKLRDKPIE